MIRDTLTEEVNEWYILYKIYNIFNTTYGTQQTEISWNLPAMQCQYNGYSTVHTVCLQGKENCIYQMNNYRYLLH
jgi:hypothetical protein